MFKEILGVLVLIHMTMSYCRPLPNGGYTCTTYCNDRECFGRKKREAKAQSYYIPGVGGVYNTIPECGYDSDGVYGCQLRKKREAEPEAREKREANPEACPDCVYGRCEWKCYGNRCQEVC